MTEEGLNESMKPMFFKKVSKRGYECFDKDPDAHARMLSKHAQRKKAKQKRKKN